MIGLLAILHALIDATSVSRVFSSIRGLSPGTMTFWILMYNLLAFAPQVFLGAAADLFAGRERRQTAKRLSAGPYSSNVYMAAAMSGALLVFAGAVISMPMQAEICLVALGNSLFHVGGGGYTLHNSRGRAAWAGVFVGPGSLGLALGTLFPRNVYFYAAALGGLVVCAALLFAAGMRKKNEAASGQLVTDGAEQDVPSLKWNSAGDLSLKALTPKILVAGVCLLCLAVVFRAFGGSFPAFTWKTGAVMALTATLFVMAGKMSGGFAYDRVGPAKTIIASIVIAGPLIAFFPDQSVPSLIGLFCLNLSMPVTLVLLYRFLPRYPAFAFGLAASSLMPGTMFGDLLKSGSWHLTGMSRNLLFIGCSIIALACVLIAIRWKAITSNRRKEELSDV